MLWIATLLAELAVDPAAGALYQRACGACHGDQGDGRGEAARHLDPLPQDFARGVFKLRSTPTGSLPNDEDLRRTVREGVPGTAMPAFRDRLSAGQIAMMVQVAKRFAPRFAEERPEASIPIPSEPPDDAGSRKIGATLYRRYGCVECHGPSGRGDGPAAAGLRDDKGIPIRAYDFTRPGRMKGGHRPADVYRTLATGMDGTPMPSYRDSVPAEDLWHLVHHVRSLVRRRPFWDWLVNRP